MESAYSSGKQVKVIQGQLILLTNSQVVRDLQNPRHKKHSCDPHDGIIVLLSHHHRSSSTLLWSLGKSEMGSYDLYSAIMTWVTFCLCRSSVVLIYI